MFKKVKKILGIEGVKMELVAPEKISLKEGMVTGVLKFTSLTSQIINQVTVNLIEKYSRGRKSSQLIDEYKLGTIVLDEPIEVQPNQIVEVEFELPFVSAKSEMDLLEESNIFMKGLVKSAKFLRNVKSTYRLEAEAKVRGTKLNPTATREIKLKR